MSLPMMPVALLMAGTAGVDTQTVEPAPFILIADATSLNSDTMVLSQAVAGEPPVPDAGPLPVDPAAPVPAGNAPVASTEAGNEDLVVQARQQVPGDPLESINAETYQVVAKVDEAVIEPVAMAYRDGLPRGIRSALSNFFSNLREPIVALNYLLQLKPGKAVETVARMAINTTLGIGGLIDVAEARPFNLPYRRNGFSNTLGYYGVGQGPFLVVPLVGATTLRDMIGSGIDQLVMPLAVGRPFTHPAYGPIAYTVNSLDYRIENDDNIDRYRESADPYAAMRDAYLARRHAEIEALHGRVVPVTPAVPVAPAVFAPAATTDDIGQGGGATIPSVTPAPEAVEARPAERAPEPQG